MTVALIKTPPVKSGGTYEINKGKTKLVRQPNETHADKSADKKEK